MCEYKSIKCNKCIKLYINIYIYSFYSYDIFIIIINDNIPNNEKNNNINDEIMMDIDNDDVNEENKEIFKKIIINLREKKMNGGNVENLARNFFKK